MDDKKKEDSIIWIDVETSGDNPENNELLEIGAIFTDIDGNRIGYDYHSLVSVSNLSKIISSSDPKVSSMHDKSGLWMDLWRDREMKTEKDVDKEFSQWIDSRGKTGNILFGGNSITLDRNFVRRYLPESYSRISHQSIDVTSLYKALSRCIPQKKFITSKHRALPDIRQSLEDYKWLMSYFREDD